MKRMAISLMLAFSTMAGLAACGPEQVDSSEVPTTGENTAALACPTGPAGYYYCPAYPEPEYRHYFWAYHPECGIVIEETANYRRVECQDFCGAACVHVGL